MTIYSLPPFLTLCSFLGLAGLTFRRGLKKKVNLLFGLLCLLGALLYIDILIIFNVQNPQVALWSSRIDHIFVLYTIPLYIHFFHAYLGITSRRWLIKAAYGYAFILMWFAPTAWCIESMDRHFFGYFGRGGRLYPLVGLGALGATLYSLKLILDAIGQARSSVQKNRLKYILAGFSLMGLMNSLNSLALLGYSIYPPGNFSFIPLLVFAFGLFKHDLLDMGLLLKKSLLYSLLTAMLTGLYALLLTIANTIFKNYAFANSLWFLVLLFMSISFIIGPLKTKIQKLLDRIFAKDKYAYQQTIKQVSQTIAAVLDVDQIARILMDTIVNTMHINRGALFLQTDTNQDFTAVAIRGAFSTKMTAHHISRTKPLVTHLINARQPILKKRLLERTPSSDAQTLLTDLDKLQSEIVLPLISKASLKGFIALGDKKSGDLYSNEDLDLLETLANQSALAVEIAHAYQTIERFNRDLEKEVAARTAELRTALHEKEKTQEQLIRSESLAALGQLVAGVAHELNNPLASVTSLIQTAIEDLEELKRKYPVDEDLLDDLQFADKELKRAKMIVKSLLDLSRQTQTYSEQVNLNTVIRDALRVLHNQYKQQQLNIVEAYDERLPTIQGNFANLGQVAINIIKNAIQAVADRNGRIFLTTRYDQTRDQVVFECRDTGPGVPAETRKDIFKPFFTTKAVGQGTGLGLYISHEIVQRHNGRLSLEDPADSGTLFIVRLPITA